MEQSLYELLRRCTVRVSLRGKTGHGTGFYAAPGLILTCAHVIESIQFNEDALEVYWNGLPHPARIMILAVHVDLALLQVDFTDHPCVLLDEQAAPGDNFYTYGYPDDHADGDPATFACEGWSGEQQDHLKFKIGQVRPGMSGAPLLNMRTGCVCGVVQRTRDRASDLGGRAIPNTVVFQKFPQLRAYQQAFHYQDTNWIACHEDVTARMKYLQHMKGKYDFITLPLGPVEGFSLQAVFQPLTLRRDPVAAEDRERGERRTLLGEPVHSENEQTVIADNGDDALAKSPQRRIIVLGGPGTGKTTLLQSLFNDRLQKAQTDLTAPIPMFISLPDLARSGKTLQEYLARLTKEVGLPDRSADILWKAIEDGNAFVCLDSLDEVIPRERPEMIRLVNELASRIGNTWVVGSRFTEYKGGQFKRGQFSEWELQAMYHNLRQQLAERLLPELNRLMSSKDVPTEDKPAEFVQILESHQRASAWSENPLLFSLAAIVFVRTGTLPSSLAALYQQVTDAIFETREQDPTRRKMLRRVVADLALELYRTKGRTFTRDDIVTLLPEVRQRQRENWSTEELANRIVVSGILDVVAQETYGFRHQTFQEYLAAVALAQRLVSQDQAVREEGWSLAWSKRTYSRWTEILRLMVDVLGQNHRREGAKQVRSWLNNLIEQRTGLEGDPGNLGLALALESLTEVSGAKMGNWKEEGGEKVEVEIVTHWITALLEEAGHKHETQQPLPHSLAWRVGYLQMSEHAANIAVERLKAVLNDTDERMREAAVQGLLGFRKPISMELVLALLNDRNSNVRRAAANLLGNVGKGLTAECLLTVLGDEDESVRTTAEYALVFHEDHTFVKQLMQALNTEDWRVFTSRAKVLAQLGERVPVEPFLAELNASDWQRRRAAIQVLGELGEDVSIESLLTALRDKEVNVRLSATWALKKRGTHIPVETLQAALQDEDWNVRSTAVEVLGESGERTAVEPLLEALQDKDSHVRAGAMRALQQLGEQAPSESLVMALQDEDWGVRLQAVMALERLGERAPIEPLLTLLDDENWDVCSTAMRTLWQRGERAAVESLLTTSGEHFAWMRAVAARVLGQPGEHAPVEPLVEALRDKQAYVRAAATWALRKLGEHTPIQPLMAALHDEHWHVREVAAQVLGKLGKRAPIELLEAALQDEYEPVRTAALAALCFLGRRPYPAGLSGSSSGKDNPMRWNVDESRQWSDFINEQEREQEEVESLGEHTPVEQLLIALRDGSWNVRKKAEEALVHLGEQSISEPLLIALRDQDMPVHAILNILGQLGKHAPVDVLVLALSNDKRENIRAAAAQALGQLGEWAPVDSLVAALHDESFLVRVEAAQALGQLGERAPVDPLVAVLQSEEGYLREKAVMALGQLGERAPVDLLIIALGDSNEGVRDAAAQVLQQIYPDALLKVVSEAAAILQGQGSAGVLSSIAFVFIAETIGTLENPSPTLLEKLTSLLDWPYWEVRMKAAQALGKLHRNIPDPAIRRLLELRRDPQSRTVRVAANNALAEILSLETGIEDD